MNNRTTIALDWIIPLAILAGLTVWLRASDIDMTIARALYREGWWPVGAQWIWRGLRDFGVIPAWIISLSALGVVIASIWRPRLATKRRAAAFLVLVMLVGPGLVVNNLFKENWGRPRPKDMVEFGGKREFVPAWTKGPRERGHSFPSGHAATAFYLVTPWFLFRRTSPRQAGGVLAVGLCYGTLMGIARMTQGAHFLSDVVWAAGFVYLTGLSFFYVMRFDRQP